MQRDDKPTRTEGDTPREDVPADADAAFRGLVQLFEDRLKQGTHHSYRRYRLEQIGGELVLRQTGADAAVEAAIRAALGDCPTSEMRDNSGRRIIKLPE